MIEIRSAETALTEAERLLATVSEKDPSTALWKSSAVYPLAAILLAVTHDNGGHATLAAVHNVAARPDAGAKNPGVPDWRWAAQACPNERLAQALGQVLAMDARQRDSIKSVILDALLGEMGAEIIAASPAAADSGHVFDEQRHAWIAAHASKFMFQRRRAALLNRKLRDCERARIGAHLDPHGAQIAPPPLLFRALEVVIVAVAALVAPVGWAAGRLLYRYLTTLIPKRMRAYPIPALLWSAVLQLTVGLLILVDAPGSQWPTPVQLWLIMQMPLAFLVAGIYGILEGWLAVKGSIAWWPTIFTRKAAGR
ncbi:hypothetical protein [Mycobacteroides abscessus]|uniref:hypothetical protein n=1 Tax=Mycobacteroides abscessus TaxID=36809 RepID=UPI000926F234|nr:hypothetical protein [Mycobacteroides abscessus]SIK54446.1 type IV secretory pathway, VirD4 component [Mycobacteroides abscessus subsp. abscessus]SKR40557.1 type IV secretory pathway, VirD4 component [Mycobacteroides abscessus subsp. abscessus]SKR55486.1 type IV secretory pathway, VirD4 component [Mycobacteroides abscessus subsp. abscessus]SKS92857.1 type IV secretory pathway, VirD4 component [Mycobacteroides abscessus subsp. abscessus]